MMAKAHREAGLSRLAIPIGDGIHQLKPVAKMESAEAD